ncbi:hypothetical protein BSZ35_00410 [Salinibacter sp. 10B]|uniref:sulfotransferase n=1 Tax=Salinibacter sp. 10B TaxID=1923971 RepID=UPI000CF429CF|nr:sulfotransferase [Salinibacter sp. 10B]PQJ33264.1 hypothetical protein BSZ35_00410 [Salinibacter sp. 10B]
MSFPGTDLLHSALSVLRRGVMRVRHVTASVNETPIIVLGNQKSGTSAIAHLLADYGALSKTVDIPPLWGYRGLSVMRRDPSFARIVADHPYFFSTDLFKEPMMTFFPEQVAERFPNATYVFVARDPRANIRSLLDSRGLPGHRTTLRDEDRQHLSASRTLLDADGWQISADSYIELLAKRWLRAIEGLRILQQKTPDCLLLRYEDFTAEKYDCIHRTATTLDLPKRGTIADKLDVAFQPRGDHRDKDWETFFGSDNLSIITTVCGEEMERLGYDRSRRSPY